MKPTVSVRSTVRIEQRALAGVGVPNQRHHCRLLLTPIVAIKLAMTVDFGQLALDERDSLAGFSAVNFELGFARTTNADSADRLTREVGPHPGQARQPVLELSEFNLKTSLVRLGAASEDIENQRRAINDLGVELLFQIAKLRR